MIVRLFLGTSVSLPAPLAERYPELLAARYRRGGLPPRVAGWFLGQSSVAAVTLWRIVWLGARTAFDPELLLHESRHVAQFGASRAFPIAYVWETVRRGYWNNRFEVDAREYAARRLRDRADPS